MGAGYPQFINYAINQNQTSIIAVGAKVDALQLDVDAIDLEVQTLGSAVGTSADTENDPTVFGMTKKVMYGDISKASDAIVLSADTERTHATAVYTTKKSFVVGVTGYIRIKLDAKSSNTNGYFKVTQNGVDLVTEVALPNTVYQTFTYDRYVKKGDLLEVKLLNASASTVYVKNAKICYDVVVPGLVVTD